MFARPEFNVALVLASSPAAPTLNPVSSPVCARLVTEPSLRRCVGLKRSCQPDHRNVHEAAKSLDYHVVISTSRVNLGVLVPAEIVQGPHHRGYSTPGRSPNIPGIGSQLDRLSVSWNARREFKSFPATYSFAAKWDDGGLRRSWRGCSVGDGNNRRQS
jgi:hypothetical protein